MNRDNKFTIDNNQIVELKDLLDEDFKNFIAVYFNDFEAKSEEMSIAIENNNLDNVNKLAHALKGNSLSVGALGLANICKQLEIVTKSGDYKATVREYQGLQKIYPKFKEEFLRIAA